MMLLAKFVSWSGALMPVDTLVDYMSVRDTTTDANLCISVNQEIDSKNSVRGYEWVDKSSAIIITRDNETSEDKRHGSELHR